MNELGNTQAQEKENGDTAGYLALKEGAGVVDRPGKTILRLSGKDPAGMLDAILTNAVPKDANLGVYAALLNPKGRVQTDLRALKSGKEMLIDTELEGAGAAREILGRYAPFSRVRIEDLSENDEAWSILGLYGPRAMELLNSLQLAEHESEEIELGGASLLAAGVTAPVPGFDLLGPADAIRVARHYLVNAGATPVESDAYETARIEAGIPRFGADITPENFPGETGILESAVSFQKGCYPGQETVARMHYRGHPNRNLHRLVVDGPPPPPDTPIVQEGKQIGRITSVAPLPVNGSNLALGYLSRNTREDFPISVGETPISSIGLVGNDSR